MSVAKQGEKRQLPDLVRMCCWDRDRSRTKLIFSWFLCLKNDIFVSECLKVTLSRKKWVKLFLGNEGVKELVIIQFRCRGSKPVIVARQQPRRLSPWKEEEKGEEKKELFCCVFKLSPTRALSLATLIIQKIDHNEFVQVSSKLGQNSNNFNFERSGREKKSEQCTWPRVAVLLSQAVSLSP